MGHSSTIHNELFPINVLFSLVGLENYSNNPNNHEVWFLFYFAVIFFNSNLSFEFRRLITLYILACLQKKKKSTKKIIFIYKTAIIF
jgi:hypothetical protein